MCLHDMKSWHGSLNFISLPMYQCEVVLAIAGFQVVDLTHDNDAFEIFACTAQTSPCFTLSVKVRNKNQAIEVKSQVALIHVNIVPVFLSLFVAANHDIEDIMSPELLPTQQLAKTNESCQTTLEIEWGGLEMVLWNDYDSYIAIVSLSGHD